MAELQDMIWKLSDIWKDHFGLYTYYVGYLSPQLIKTILQVKRSTDNESMLDLKDMDLLRTNVYAAEHGIRELPNEKVIEDVLPRIWDYLKTYDLSDDSVPAEKWNMIVEYLDQLAAKERS